jgi:(p)ppGpp synthase/HD superfamily hydrolase
MSKALLGHRFEEALTLAARLHATQTKKGTKVPYIAGVASLVLEDGGDEDQAIAALLHDSIEDQGLTEAEIEEQFGPRVREIVVACTDALEYPKPPWRPRKEAYLAHLAEAPPEVLRVSAADKLHNARQILTDYRGLEDALWDRFNGKRDGTLWYYRSLADMLLERLPGPLTQELARVVDEIERLAGVPG